MRRWLPAAVALALAGVPPAAAQAEDALGPVLIELDDIHVEQVVVPLKEPATVTLTGRIGCEAVEGPADTTSAALFVPEAPGFIQSVIAPSTLSWGARPDACATGDAPPYEIEATMAIAVSQNAPAFEPVTFPLQVLVTKTSPEPAPARSYGPGHANVTLTPGYFPLYNVAADQKFDRAPANGTARFNISIQNLGNGETRFALAANETPPGLEVTIEPATLTLGRDEEGDVAIEARRGDERERAAWTFDVVVTSASTHPDGGAGPAQELSFQATFEPSASELLDVPGAGGLAAVAAGVAGALAGAGVFGRRGVRRDE